MILLAVRVWTYPTRHSRHSRSTADHRIIGRFCRTTSHCRHRKKCIRARSTKAAATSSVAVRSTWRASSTYVAYRWRRRCRFRSRTAATRSRDPRARVTESAMEMACAPTLFAGAALFSAESTRVGMITLSASVSAYDWQTIDPVTVFAMVTPCLVLRSPA